MRTVSVDLVFPICDSDCREMLETLRPIVICQKSEESFEVDIEGVDLRKTAYTWSPKLGRKVCLGWRNGACCTIPTFHSYGAPSLFKPSLAEVLGAIRHYVPDWKREGVRWFLLAPARDARDIIGEFHAGRCHLFNFEFGPEAFIRPAGS